MNTLTCTLLMFLTCVGTVTAKPKQQTPAAETRQVDGVSIRLQFLSDDIVRVVKYSGGAMPQKGSYSVVMEPQAASVATSESGQLLTMASRHISATLDLSTGCITFADRQGATLLAEKGRPLIDPWTDGVDKGKCRIGQTWTLDKEEDIYGLGQLRDEAMSWRGRDTTLWNNNTYIAIPYVSSSKGYGLYWDNAGRSRFTDNAGGMTFTSEVSPCIDYYFLYRDGTQDGVIAAIRTLTGQATMFPLWAMGHWQCRERYKTSDELAQVLDRYRELQIPLDGIVQDWQYWGCDSNWNAMRFENPYYINKVGDPAWEKYLPDDLRKLAREHNAKGLQPRLKSPQEMVGYVHSNNAHLMISIWASFGPWTEAYRQMKEAGALLPFDTWPRNKGVLPYDAFNPKARDIYWQHLSQLYQMGFDAWWTDSTEPDHFEKEGDDDYMTHDGSWRSVKNAFPLLHNKGIYEHQRQAESAKARKARNYRGKRSLQMTRSGAFGLQHYGTFSWSGDVLASWAEMKRQVPSGLNYTLCGIPFWNTDLGGFFYWEFEQDPKNPAIQELQTRWMQWGTFMPLMRNHCSSPMVSEIYAFGSKGDWAYDAMTAAVRLRYRLLPYIYSMAGETVQHSGSMMRPLVMDFATDRKARRLNDEYMFGHALLVKPVTDPFYTWKSDDRKGHLIYPDIRQAAAPVSVYLPKSPAPVKWYDFFTNEVFDGGRTIMRPTPITDMPVYVRGGSIVPFGPEVQFSSEKPWDSLEMRVYPGADGTFTLYEDEGDGYAYERGSFTEIPFRWDDASRTLTIGQRRGSYPGMLAKRTFRIVLIGSGSGRGDQPMTGGRTVDYDGSQLTITL